MAQIKSRVCIYMPLQSVGNLYSIVNSFLLENIFCLLCATALAGWDDNLTILGRDGMKHQVCSSQKQRIFDKPKRVAAHIIHLFKYQFLGMNAESRLFIWKKSSFDLPHGPPLNKLFWRQFTQKKGAYNVTDAITFWHENWTFAVETLHQWLFPPFSLGRSFCHFDQLLTTLYLQILF